jgi:hypothetical protein
VTFWWEAKMDKSRDMEKPNFLDDYFEMTPLSDIDVWHID